MVHLSSQPLCLILMYTIQQMGRQNREQKSGQWTERHNILQDTERNYSLKFFVKQHFLIQLFTR